MSRARIHLFRNTKAIRRADWDGPDLLRPLATTGMHQARQLADQLGRPGALTPGTIWTSPALRCRQTVDALAARTGLVPRVEPGLGPGSLPEKAAALLRDAGPGVHVACTHGDLLEDLAALLEEEPGIELQLHRRPEVEVREESRRLGVLDLGSTSFHLLVADVNPAGHLVPVDREREQLRLGAVMAHDDEIPQELFELAVDTARSLRTTAEALGTEELFVVGTSALREASNGPLLAEALAGAVGGPVRILSGLEEARIIFGALRRRVLLPRAAVLGADLGGGSLELIVARDRDVQLETTLPLGAARLHGEIVHSDPMRNRELRAVCERADQVLAPWVEPIRAAGPRLAVATGGSARALGHLAIGLRGLDPTSSVNELQLSLAELRQLNEILVRATHDERVALPGIRRRRADLLPTAALIFTILAETLGIEGFTLCDWGLREGILLETVTGERAGLETVRA